MSSIILLVIVGLFLLGGLVLVAGVFFEEKPTPQRIENEQKQLADITDPDRLVEMAEKYERHDKWEPAINTWSRYLELNSDAEQARFRRGVARHEAGKAEQTIEDLSSVTENLDDPPAQVHLYLARAHLDLEDEPVALDEFRTYLEEHPGDRSVVREAASLARSMEEPTVAREIYDRMRNLDDPQLFVEGTLALIEMDLDDGNEERAEEHFEEIEQARENQQLPDQQRWEYLYQRARQYELQGEQEEADELFRTIYRENPDFRDVSEIVEERIQSMSEDELIKKMLTMDRDDFIRYSEDIVELMGYEVMSSDSINPDEVNISAREKAKMMKVNRVLFAFKKWDNQAGEIPIKEFELKMLEDRYDRGFFVCPGGFNHKAKEYETDSQDLELVGPERLLNYLKEAEKQRIN